MLRNPLLLGLALLGFACSPETEARKPNVVLISIDNLGADHMGCYGYEQPITPFMDALAAKGTLFENVTAQDTWTLPSHASMLSSRYVGAHGVWMIENRLASLNLPLVQESFQAVGFATAAFTTCQFLSLDYGFTRGFDTFSLNDEPAEKVTPKVIDHLSGMEEPFFLFLHYYDVHAPFTEKNPYGPDLSAGEPTPEAKAEMKRMRALQGKRLKNLTEEERAWIAADYPDSTLNEWLGTEEGATKITFKEIENLAYHYLLRAGAGEMGSIRGAYDNGVAYMDLRLGELFQRLEAFPWFANTIFAVTSDHGEAFSEHQGVFGHGGAPFQELVKVPLFIVGPGIAKGRRIKSPVAGIDIAPTLLALAQVSVPEGFQGRSLGEALRQGEPALRTILSGSQDAKKLSFQEGSWKLVMDLEKGDTWLFDVASPEGERLDRADEHPEKVTLLKEKLMQSEKYNKMASSNLIQEKVNLSEESKARLKALGYL